MRHFEIHTPTFVYAISPPSFSPGLKLTIIIKFQVWSVTMFTNSLFALFPLNFTSNFFRRFNFKEHLNTIKYFLGPTVKNLKGIHQFCFADDTTVFVYDLSSHYYFAAHCPGWDLPELWAEARSVSRSANLLPKPQLLGPFIQDPAMGSAGLSIDQTKQEWQFRMLICVTAAAAALTAISSSDLQKIKQRNVHSAAIWVSFPSVFVSLFKLDLLRERGGHCPILTLQVILHSVNIGHFRVCFYLWAMTGLVTWHLIFGRNIRIVHCFVYITPGNINPFH